MIRRFSVLLFCAACASDSWSMSGVGAFTPNAELALGSTVPFADGGVALVRAQVLIASTAPDPLQCINLVDGGVAPIGSLLAITLQNVDGSPVAPGPYQVVDPREDVPAGVVHLAALSLSNNDLDAGTTSVGNGTSGTVVLTRITEVYTGTFTATVWLADGGGGGLTGSFNAFVCATQ